MKLKYIFPVLLLAIFSTSCSSDDDNDTDSSYDNLDNLEMVQEIKANDHTIELYTESGMFYTGYNNVTVRVKDNTTDEYFENVDLSWMPMMDMGSMMHSCPHSSFEKTVDSYSLYNTMAVYQMTFEDGSGWTLNFDYTINDIEYTASSTIEVWQADKQNVTTFTGADNIKYVLALIEPQDPIIGSNDMTVGLYKMESMMSFPIVKDYTIGLDPRMPSMGNHSSPNNTDLTYTSSDSMYNGLLNLTMSGYWVLNLKLYNAENDLLKGEDITEENEESSLYLELEF